MRTAPRGLAPLCRVAAAALAVAVLLVHAGSINEDAWIVFRFARNLGDGHGLVPFPGCPPQDGFTSLAKTVWLGLGHAVGLPIPGLAIATGMLAFVAAAIVAGRWLARLVPGPWRPTAAALGTIGALAGLELAYWCSAGLVAAEVALALVATAALLHRTVLEPTRARLLGLALLSLLAWTLRPEGILVGPLVLVLLLAGAHGSRRPLPRRAGLEALALLVLGGLGLAAFRIACLGDLWSNPAWVKLAVRPFLDPWRDFEGWLALRGGLFAVVLGLALVQALAVSLTGLLRRSLDPLGLAQGVLVGFLAYRWFFDWYVHGDYMDGFRFLAPDQPLVAVLFGCAGLQAVRNRWLRGLAKPVRIPVLLLPIAVGIGTGLFPPGNTAWRTGRDGGAAGHRAAMVEAAARLRELLASAPPGQDVYATSEFGYVPYHVPHEAIDLMGLNDRRIAWTHALYADLGEAVAAARDSVLARTPTLIATYGYARRQGGPLEIAPGIGWWFSCYFDSAFFRSRYDWERELPEALGPRLRFSTLRRPVPEMRSVGVAEPAHDVRLMHGFTRGDDGLRAGPIARILLDRETTSRIPAPGASMTLQLRGRVASVPISLEVRVDDDTVGDRLVRCLELAAGRAFEVRFPGDEIPFATGERLLLSLWARSADEAPHWYLESCGWN